MDHLHSFRAALVSLALSLSLPFAYDTPRKCTDKPSHAPNPGGYVLIFPRSSIADVAFKYFGLFG